jgi:hypothetical protein
LHWRAAHAAQFGFAAAPAALSPRLAIRIFLNMSLGSTAFARCARGAIWLHRVACGAVALIGGTDRVEHEVRRRPLGYSMTSSG